jgi:hypothetical protein
MSKRRYTYDSDCESLAAHFLAGERIDESVLWDLAQHIQDAVQEWFGVRDLMRDPSEALPSGENVPDMS